MKATEALEIINGFCLARTTLKMSLEERDREQTKVLESYAKELARKAFYTNPLTYIQEYGREDAFEKYFESLTADR